MSIALLLLPDFLLIALGFVLCRWTSLDRSVWDGTERLVYYLLFPVLLFGSIVRNPFTLGTVAQVALAGVVVTATGVALAYALGRLRGVDGRLHASGAQVAFRFNSYVALALAERLGGAAGVATVAVLVAVCVPLANVGAVWPLARHGGLRPGMELLRNPLILATAGGLLANLAGLRLGGAVETTVLRIGSAALPLGLMAVGAGLRFGALRASPRLATALLAIRHAALPGLALVLARAMSLSALEQVMVVAFSALPTASSCYVLAARLGGDGGFVAGLVTVSTLLGLASVPLALLALAATGTPVVLAR
jgi:predicted permease